MTWTPARPTILPYYARSSLRRLCGQHLPPALRRVGESLTSPKRQRGPLDREAALAMVEAALIGADEPLNTRRLAAVAGLQGTAEARRLVQRLQQLYAKDGSAFQVQEIAGGYQLLTRPEYHPWLARLRQRGQELRLSQAARETLAIVAYRQPIMRAEIESIRGVQCGDILRVLIEKGLIRIAGRHNSLGRPVLYGTTRKFLQLFGLKSLDDLPQGAGVKGQESGESFFLTPDS